MQAGAAVEKIQEVPRFRESPLFDERERVALEFAERMTITEEYNTDRDICFGTVPSPISSGHEKRWGPFRDTSPVSAISAEIPQPDRQSFRRVHERDRWWRLGRRHASRARALVQRTLGRRCRGTRCATR